MKMKCCFLLSLCFALNSCQGVDAGNDQDVKRGMHPYMAFIFYSDPSVVDVSGQRFVRSAILIRANWLVTTAIGPSLMDPLNGFPKKTLLARAGAIAIDPKFTLNEDEDEQEREIVQIVRPYNHSATQWWTTDISLMKTLLPFNMTSAVSTKTLNLETETIDLKTCSILVYAKKYGNTTEDKKLMVLFVDLLPPSIANCGSHFAASTMACAADSDNNSEAVYDPNFCQGNSGGPLIYNNEVVGLQTYIGNDCKQPHLYQLLLPWDTFIACGIEDRCQEKNCGSVCDVIYKDPPKAEVRITPPVTRDTAQDIIAFLNVPSTTSLETTTDSIPVSSPTVTAVTTTIVSFTSTDLVSEATVTVNLSETTSTRETLPTTPETTTNTMLTITESLIAENTEKSTDVELVSHWHSPWPIEKVAFKTATESAIQSMTKKKSWPKEISTLITGNKDEKAEVERKAKVEARKAPKVRIPSVSNRNLSVVQTVFLGFIVMLCL